MLRLKKIYEAKCFLCKDLFIKVSIQKSSLDIHLVQLEAFIYYICNKEPDVLKSCYRSQCVTIVNALYLAISFHNQPCFVSYHVALFI